MKATIMFDCGECGNSTPGVFEMPGEDHKGAVELNCDCVHCQRKLLRKFRTREAFLKTLAAEDERVTIHPAPEDGGAASPISVEKGGWFIGDECIDSVTLYDKDDNAIGDVALIEKWRCEYRYPDGKVTTGDRETLAEAIQFLMHYGKDALASGGFINGAATFLMYPLPEK